MERWVEVTLGRIPKEMYSCELSNGEMNGLVICLYSETYEVTFDFGLTLGVRMYDEGCVLLGWPPLEIIKEKRGFKNTIYRIFGGEFLEDIRKKSSTVYEDKELFHYVIVTMDYFIEVVTQWEPEITVKDKRIRDDNAGACD